MSSSDRLLLTGVLAAAAAVAGCGHFPGAFESAHAPPGTMFLGRSLPAAGPEEAPDEIVEFYEHEGDFRPRPAPKFPGEQAAARETSPARKRRPRSEVSYHVGARYGRFMPGEADYRWPDGQYLGLFLRRTPRGPHRMSIELGGEFVKLSAGGGSVFTRMYVLHADCLLGRMGGRGLAAYAVVGGQLVLEEADLYYMRDVARFGGGAEIGVAIGSHRGRWEIRAVYTAILSSGRNAAGSWTASLGFAF